MNFGGMNRDLQNGGPANDTPMVDTAEQVYISSLSLLKMLKHGRAGVPMEVMGFVKLSMSLSLFTSFFSSSILV